MINEKEAPRLKPWQAATVLFVAMSLIVLIIWAWWSESGPFRPKKPTREVIDLMADVKYVNPQVRFEEFTNFDRLISWRERNGPSPAWGGSKIDAVCPYLSDTRHRKKKEEIIKTHECRQYLANRLANSIIMEGFQLPPRVGLQSQKANRTSRADIRAVIKTGKQKDLVIFCVETTVYSNVRAEIKKPTLLYVQLTSCQSEVYVVEEKNVFVAMTEVLAEHTRITLRFARSAELIPYNAPPPSVPREFTTP